MEDIQIIFEDDNILVINKPAGLLVHDDGHNTEPTLIDWLLERYPNIAEVGEPMKLQDGTELKRPGIVHRLDKDTSGVLVVAKNQTTFEYLKTQFQDRLLNKKYLALVHGEFKELSGVVELPIGRSKRDPRLRVAHQKASGKLREALTEYQVLEQFGHMSLVEARPKTGRTHQIRVHLKAIQHPIVCDELYAPGWPCPEELGRQALHAAELEITLPGGEKKSFKAELPRDFQEALDKLRMV
jgi:23S rRNA pseudouridine1911/1915/1917 synthase